VSVFRKPWVVSSESKKPGSVPASDEEQINRIRYQSWCRTSVKLRLYKLAGVLISASFIYFAVRQVDFSEALRAMGTVQFGWLLGALFVYLLAFPVRALRWRRLLHNQEALPFRKVMVAVLVGHMANNVLPARTGEIYRAHFLGRRAQMSRSGVMGSIVVERIFDVLVLVCLMLLLFILFPETRLIGGVALATFGLFLLALATGIIFYSFTVGRSHQAIDKIFGILPQEIGAFISRRLKSFLRGTRSLSTVEGYLETVAYTVLIWTLEIGAVALIVISFGVVLPLSGYLLVHALAALSTALPSGPAYVGPYQYAFILALGFFAISEEKALAISVVAHLTLLGSVTLIGGVLLWREQLRAGPPPDRKKLERVRGQG
jgi:glycosyltransferase 2 family protein